MRNTLTLSAEHLGTEALVGILRKLAAPAQVPGPFADSRVMVVWRRLSTLLFIAALLVVAGASSAFAAGSADLESCFLDKINADRQSAGAGPLVSDADLSSYARSHSSEMAAKDLLYHSSVDEVSSVLDDGWSGWAENVGMGGGMTDCDRLHSAFMSSSGHRTNLLNPKYDYAGIGVVTDGGGTMWTTHVFVDGPIPNHAEEPVSTSVGLGPFVDDDGSVHEADIVRLAAAGITSGCGPDRFCPGQVVTRGQMAAFLRRALDLPKSSSDYFSDDSGNVFENDINALADAGVTKGCGGNSFCADGVVTRGQMAAFLARALGLPASSTDHFNDDDGSPFEDAINSLADAGITTGCATGAYCPGAPVTRAQMATFLVRSFL